MDYHLATCTLLLQKANEKNLFLKIFIILNKNYIIFSKIIKLVKICNQIFFHFEYIYLNVIHISFNKIQNINF